MNREQEKIFHETGCLHLAGALTKKLVSPIKAHILNELTRQDLWSSGRNLSQKLKAIPVFQQTTSLSQLIPYPDLSKKLLSQDVLSVMGKLVNASLLAQESQLLISLPHSIDWSLENLNWHRDIAMSKTGFIPGIQVFFLLDDVAIKGGATLAVAGSHRIQNQLLLKESVASLVKGNACVMQEGIELSIIEMAGKAGDIYLMDMRLLHTPSINASRNPRLMATARYFVK